MPLQLELRYAEAAEREAQGLGKAEETEARMIELRGKMDELTIAKADRVTVERALLVTLAILHVGQQEHSEGE
jgi:hypothetical protein